jgi:hypothetical protein
MAPASWLSSFPKLNFRTYDLDGYAQHRCVSVESGASVSGRRSDAARSTPDIPFPEEPLNRADECRHHGSFRGIRRLVDQAIHQALDARAEPVPWGAPGPGVIVAAPLDRRGGEGRGIPIPGPLGPDARSTVPRDGAGDPAARHNPEQGGAGENRPRMTLDVTLPSHGFTPLSTQRLHRLGDVPASRVHLPMQTVTSMLLGGVEYASGEARARASHTSGWRPHDILTTRGQPRASSTANTA